MPRKKILYFRIPLKILPPQRNQVQIDKISSRYHLLKKEHHSSEINFNAILSDNCNYDAKGSYSNQRKKIQESSSTMTELQKNRKITH